MKKYIALFIGLSFIAPILSYAQVADVSVQPDIDCDVTPTNLDCVRLQQLVLQLEIQILQLQLQQMREAPPFLFDLPQPDTAGMSETEMGQPAITTSPKPECVQVLHGKFHYFCKP